MSDNTNSGAERRPPVKERVVRQGGGARIRVGSEVTRQELDRLAALRRRLQEASQARTTAQSSA